MTCYYIYVIFQVIRSRIIKLETDLSPAIQEFIHTHGHYVGVCFTSDMWTSASKRGYMVVTAHFIDADFNLRSVILAFVRVLYPHDAKKIATVFVEILKKYKLASKFVTLTARTMQQAILPHSR